jgi:predicted transcriptional regulator
MSLVLAEKPVEISNFALNQAIAEADKGVFVSNKKVEAWVMSLGTTKELPRPKADIFKQL